MSFACEPAEDAGSHKVYPRHSKERHWEALAVAFLSALSCSVTCREMEKLPQFARGVQVKGKRSRLLMYKCVLAARTPKVLSRAVVDIMTFMDDYL